MPTVVPTLKGAYVSFRSSVHKPLNEGVTWVVDLDNKRRAFFQSEEDARAFAALFESGDSADATG